MASDARRAGLAATSDSDGTNATPMAIYMDYAATTPVDPAVVQAMVACMGLDGDFGNSGSATHEFGRRAAAKVDTARMQVASLLGTCGRNHFHVRGDGVEQPGGPWGRPW